MDQIPRATFFKTILPISLLTLALIAILVFPVDRSLLFLGDATDRGLNLILVMSGLYVLWVVSSRFSKWIGIALCVVVILSATVVRLLNYALVDFSGQGFGPEFFVHLEAESVRIAWYEYGRLIRRALIVCIVAVVCGITWHLAARKLGGQKRWRFPRVMMLMLAAASVLVLVSARDHTPEWQLWVAWSRWQSGGAYEPTEQVEAASNVALQGSRRAAMTPLPESINRWVESGLITIPPKTSAEIQAETIGRPANLLLLYVEALTTSIVRHADYEDLMPGLRDLLDEHSLINDFYTSSHVTIEGVANTQCGLLFPFRGHGSGFAGREMLAEALPCLGDVLAVAGYHQSYILGGGPMSFTGKGDFLAAHGFNDLRGWEYWRARGFTRAPGHWGMGDVETLEQVRQLIVERREMEQPFSITTLTVGSHIPGYSYPECDDYRDGTERYLNALHCTDQVITKWIESLQEGGLLDNTVLVVVGDHPVFSNPEMARLFGEAIEDPRIPLVVIGDRMPDSVHQRGAGYDLAPTILDLLRIQHNTRFVMGRSLIRPHDRPDYLVNRRFDIQEGKVVVPEITDCGAGESGEVLPLSLPLSSCDKDKLMDALFAVTLAYSHQSRPLDCQQDDFLEVQLPTHGVGPASIVVNGREWSSRFTWRQRIVHPNDKGLFVLAFSSTGQPQDRIFVPESVLERDTEEELALNLEESGFILFAWRPSTNEPMDLSSVFSSLPDDQSGAGIWIGDPSSQVVLLEGAESGKTVTLAPRELECHRLVR